VSILFFDRFLATVIIVCDAFDFLFFLSFLSSLLFYYKARERIHRSNADLRLLATPTSRGRVADPDPN